MTNPVADAFSLAGKTAAVTGAGGGIGTAIAIAFSQAGARVACIDVRSPDATVKAIRDGGGEAIAVVCDVADESQTLAAAEQVSSQWGDVQVLVNGAANDDPTGSILQLSPADWQRVLSVNLTGPYLMSRAFLPGIIRSGGGSVIHIASQMGHVGSPGRPSYCATKGALLQLTKVMALDHAADNVRVNSLSPGAVETRRLLLREHRDMETAKMHSAAKHPLGRVGQPVEIATAAVFLASAASSFMTGTDLLVDGGYIAQ